MRIAINLRLLVPGKTGGMEVYIRNLLKHMLTLESGHDYLLFVTAVNNDSFEFPDSRVRKDIITHRNFKREIPRRLEQWKADIYFCPLLVLEPEGIKIPAVVNIPDLQHEFFPEFFSKKVLKWRKENFKNSADHAAAVLTLSGFSKDTIVKLLGADRSKVYDIHLAAGEEYNSACDEDRKKEVKAKHSLPDFFGFFPANTWPHKNHLNLIKALKIYSEKYGSCPQVILTGASDEGHTAFMVAIKENGLEEKIKFLGYVEKNDMPYIFRNASFLVFPSLFEGFGIPVLEAMLSGCPVVCSKTTSLPEVAGDAAIYFDPKNPEEIAEGIRRVVTDGTHRARLVKDGLRQAARFGWDKTAAETFKVFKKIERRRGKKTSSKKPLVTIITPSFNQGRFIEETILSVLNQDYSNIEYLVIDGGSKDNTLEILKKYEGRLKWISEPDKGQADAINKGFRIAKGEIVAWMNSDDTYLPFAVSRAVECFNANPELMMVYGDGYEIDEQSKVIRQFSATQEFDLKKLVETWDYILQPTVFMKKKALDEVGLLDMNLSWCLDWDLWIRIGQKFKIGYLPDLLAASRLYGQTKTSTGGRKRYREIKALLHKYGEKKFPPGYFLYGFDCILSVLKSKMPSIK
ncbi:MAG: glycosyltransferase [Deltaproteobacteria bacterium]|nr:glycosyltransferase [Deltaproteobacteria bacterium]